MELLRFALLAVVIGAVAVTALPTSIDQDECSKGPEFWCENIRNSKQCNAVQHCIHNVWENQVVLEDNGTICSSCLNMVRTGRNLITSNLTQLYLEALVKYLCHFDVFSNTKTECEYLSNGVPEIVTILGSHLKPKIICSVIGFCNNAKYDQLLEEFIKRNNLSASVVSAVLNPIDINPITESDELGSADKMDQGENDDSEEKPIDAIIYPDDEEDIDMINNLLVGEHNL